MPDKKKSSTKTTIKTSNKPSKNVTLENSKSTVKIAKEGAKLPPIETRAFDNSKK